jgi:cellulose synthase/poly-beta-1,6-N-acetylglucosamine synthase-like glycosyltransferase
MAIVLAIFFLSSVALIWAFAGYPLALLLLAKLRPNPIARRPQFPKVTVLVCTYNEAQLIERRLNNLVESDYPLDKLEILVVDSASPDGTADLVDRYCVARSDAPVRLIREDARRGKVSAINLGISQAQGEIIVLTDAPTIYWPDTIRLVMENFSDPRVGAVTGKWVDYPDGVETPAQKSRQPVIAFRTLLRQLESAVDSTYAVTGELLAFRKSLLSAIPSQFGMDDLYIAIHVRSQGYRVIADSRAAYTEKSPETYSDLVTQKKKESAGCTQIVLHFRSMIFNRHYGLYGLLILPTKVMHSPFNPIIFTLALVSGLVLAAAWLGIETFLVIVFAAVIIGFVLGLYRQGVLVRPLLALILSEWILLKGVIMYISGRYSGLWEQPASTRR